MVDESVTPDTVVLLDCTRALLIIDNYVSALTGSHRRLRKFLYFAGAKSGARERRKREKGRGRDGSCGRAQATLKGLGR